MFFFSPYALYLCSLSSLSLCLLTLTCLHDFRIQSPWLKISGGQEAESTAQLNSRIWALQSLAFEKEPLLDPNMLCVVKGELGEAQLLLP